MFEVPDGKPVNKFAFNEEFKDQQFAAQIVKHTHESWKALIAKESDNAGISLANATIQLSSEKISQDAAKDTLGQQSALSGSTPLPSTIDTYFYVPNGI